METICRNELGRRSFTKFAAALGGASTVGTLPNLAGAQDTPQQAHTPAITIRDVPFSSGAKLTRRAPKADRSFWHHSSLHPEPRSSTPLWTLSLRHIAPVREEYAVSNDDMKMFGIIEIETTLRGCRFALGIRNAHDKSMRFAMSFGYRLS